MIYSCFLIINESWEMVSLKTYVLDNRVMFHQTHELWEEESIVFLGLSRVMGPGKECVDQP